MQGLAEVGEPRGWPSTHVKQAVLPQGSSRGREALWRDWWAWPGPDPQGQTPTHFHVPQQKQRHVPCPRAPDSGPQVLQESQRFGVWLRAHAQHAASECSTRVSVATGLSLRPAGPLRGLGEQSSEVWPRSGGSLQRPPPLTAGPGELMCRQGGPCGWWEDMAQPPLPGVQAPESLDHSKASKPTLDPRPRGVGTVFSGCPHPGLSPHVAAKEVGVPGLSCPHPRTAADTARKTEKSVFCTPTRPPLPRS